MNPLWRTFLSSKQASPVLSPIRPHSRSLRQTTLPVPAPRANGDYTNRKSIIEAADKGVGFIGSWRDTTENKPCNCLDPRFAPSASALGRSDE